MLDIDHDDDTTSFLNFSEDNNDSESGSELQTVAKPDVKPAEPFSNLRNRILNLLLLVKSWTRLN